MHNFKSMIKPLGAVLLMSALAVSNAVAALPESVKTLMDGYEFRNVSVSPSGKYISLVMKEDERGTLVILNRETMKVEESIRYEDDDNMEIAGGSWVAENIFKYRVLTEYSEGRRPFDVGDQFIFNMETRKNTRIWNYKGTLLNKALRSGKRIYGRLDILSYLPSEDKNILVAVSPFKRDGGVRPTVYKLELSTGDLTKVMNGPARAASMLTNETAETIVASAPTEEFTTEFFFRRSGDKEWTDIDINLPGRFTGLNVSDDGKLVYGLTQTEEGPNAPRLLVSIALDTGVMETVQDFGFVSQISVEFGEGGYPSYATWVEDGPKIRIFKKDSVNTLVAGFMKSFKGFNVGLTSVDASEENMVFHVSSPGMTGDGFNNYMQVYAELGYAVFAPNFRGSGGYGYNFEKAGYTHWGTHMLDDMRDGAEYVQANYDVGDKVYTAGASYGGYSSAQNVVRHNDYYDCSIIDAGFFNFEELKDTWDGRDGFTTDAFTDNAMGTNRQRLKAMSPLYNIDRMKAPMLITHGKVDRRTPIAGAKQFIKALEKTDLDFEYYAYAKEGHGLWFVPNRLDRYAKVQKFLQRCDAMPSKTSS